MSTCEYEGCASHPEDDRMHIKCSPCTDIAIKNGETAPEAADSLPEAISWFPVIQVLNLGNNASAVSTALPMCYPCRKLQMHQNSRGLVAA